MKECVLDDSRMAWACHRSGIRISMLPLSQVLIELWCCTFKVASYYQFWFGGNIKIRVSLSLSLSLFWRCVRLSLSVRPWSELKLSPSGDVCVGWVVVRVAQDNAIQRKTLLLVNTYTYTVCHIWSMYVYGGLKAGQWTPAALYRDVG